MVYETLCYVQNNFTKFPRANLITTLVGFYRDDELYAAKKLLYSYVESLNAVTELDIARVSWQASVMGQNVPGYIQQLGLYRTTSKYLRQRLPLFKHCCTRRRNRFRHCQNTLSKETAVLFRDSDTA